MECLKRTASMELAGGESLIYYTTMDSPIGELLLVSDGDSIIQVSMDSETFSQMIEPDWKNNGNLSVLSLAEEQLKEYFAGDRKDFQIPLSYQGTAFQKKVWSELRKIPYGEVLSYGQLAERIGNPKSSRAVGLANGKNPIAILVPCHRIIGADGSLTGYAGGLHRKRFLLELESGEVSFNKFQKDNSQEEPRLNF